MASTTRIIVLGAGYGGVLTAKKLSRKFRNRNDIAITLIERNTYHTMLTELHEVAAGRVPEESVRIELKTIFAGRKVAVVQDDITDIRFAERTLISASTEYAYDYLVIGTGSKPTFFGTKGAQEHCHQLWSYDDAVKLNAHILGQFRKAANEPDPQVRAAQLRFVVVGCGFTGVEMVGELAEWKPRLCRRFRIDPTEVTIMAVDVLPSVLPIFPERLVRKAEKRLKKLGVDILTGTGVQEVGPDFTVLNGYGTVKTSTVIWTAGIEGSTLAGGLSLRKEARHRIVTNDYLQAQDDPRVYVVGDNAYALAGETPRPVPQMVENAEHSASLVVRNITASIEGTALKPYAPDFHGAMVCVGGRYGVAHVGLPGRFMAFSGFPAMFIKHFINLVYFVQVAGISKCWSYLKHEFFKVPDRRSFVGGHFSKASPNFWLVPLRVFVGGKWLMEGLGKLPRILKDSSDIFLIPPPASGVSGATPESSLIQPLTDGFHSLTAAMFSVLGNIGWAEGYEEAEDAISGATVAAPVTAVPDATSAATAAVTSGTPYAADTAANAASQFGPALPVPDFITEITNKFMTIFFYTQDGGYTFLAQLFQTAMVLGEVAIGLCLISGLFTFPASVVALLMGLMIWASGMAGPEMLWYIAASFATMGGSGSVFGLDYYVLPWLKTQWNRIPLVRKWYLFID